MAKILVIDDDVQVREFLRRTLSERKHTVLTVPDVAQAYASVKEKTFDLIILDLQMPGETGDVFLRNLRAAQNKVLIVVYSGVVTADMEKLLRQSGANEVLRKDVDILLFIRQVEKILEAKERIFSSVTAAKKRTILVVDDDRMIREALRKYFASRGYQVVEADSGEQALAIVKNEAVSVVLLDFQLPGMNGLATLKEMLACKPDLGVVMVTGQRDDESIRQALKLGAYDYVVKPFDFLYLDLVVISKLIIAGRQ